MNPNTMKISRMWRSVTLTSLLGLGLMASDASATILLTRANNTSQGDAVAPFPATNLNWGGLTTSLNFATTVPNQWVRVIVTANCSIAGAATNRLGARIYVDPAGAVAEFPLNPTDNALCSGNDTDTQNDGYVSAVIQGFAQLPNAGVHTIRVQVTPNPGAAWRIDNLNLVIDSE
jgi:hypothetical protein